MRLSLWQTPELATFFEGIIAKVTKRPSHESREVPSSIGITRNFYLFGSELQPYPALRCGVFYCSMLYSQGGRGGYLPTLASKFFGMLAFWDPCRCHGVHSPLLNSSLGGRLDHSSSDRRGDFNAYGNSRWVIENISIQYCQNPIGVCNRALMNCIRSLMWYNLSVTKSRILTRRWVWWW